MDLHHLKIFYISCKEKSFTRASKKLFISQSAVSIQVKKLEESLGVQLIERSSKKFKLTYIGKELYKMSSEIFDKIIRMENEIKKIVDNNTNKIVIGTTHSIGEPILPEIISSYKKLKPDIEFDIYIKNQESLLNYLYEGDIDIVLLNSYIIENNDVLTIETDDYPFVVVAHKDIKTVSDLSSIYYLKRDDENSTKYIPELFKLLKTKNAKTMGVNGSIETIKQLIKNNLGYSILPYYCVHSEIENQEFNLIHTFHDIELKFQIALLKENRNKGYLSEFITFLKKYKIR